jgi:hypothetical protein
MLRLFTILSLILGFTPTVADAGGLAVLELRRRPSTR